MTKDTSHDSVRPVVAKMAEDTRAGKMSRREFVALASTFGASATAAYGLLGLAVPTAAYAEDAKKGGVLRVASRVMDITDPRKTKQAKMLLKKIRKQRTKKEVEESRKL